MVGDDPDGKKKHDEGGDGVDNEHRGEAGEPHHHGVEAGVDAAAEHGNGEAEAASKGPGEKRLKEGERVNLALPGNISLLMRCITGLMPKAWLMNITMVISRGERPRVGLMARRSPLQWE